MSFVVFFGDFLTVLMFGGFYLGTIIYEKSFINIFKDSFVILTPPIVWIFLVLNFSEFSFTDYSMEYRLDIIFSILVVERLICL